MTTLPRRSAAGPQHLEEYSRATSRHGFVDPVRAHEAWEDTELFPAFRRLVSPAQLQELGEQFEEIEHRNFGQDGFADTVNKVVQLERHVGIQGLDTYTPQERAKVSP